MGIRQKVQMNGLPLSNQDLPKPADNFPVLIKHYQGLPSFSRTFKALNLQHLNSSTLKDPGALAP